MVAQAPHANSLVQLHSVTTAERNSITGVAEGSLIYDSDEEALYTYTATNSWVSMSSGTKDTYVGKFILDPSTGVVSITDVPFQPTMVTFTAHANIESYTIDADNGVDNNTLGLQNSFGNCDGFARDDAGTIVQQMIFSGGHGNSINDISRFSSDQYCIGIRFGDQNGIDLGKIIAQLRSFDANGFTMRVGTNNGTINAITTNPRTSRDPAAVQDERLVVLYTAYR